ncbi:MAG TPA: hypothetical protein PLG75_00075 [Methanoculleus sp.]|nr:hypothetical protein [Methanoculleus sp.]
MIEISEQKMATVLTVAIQTLVVGGLIACIVVGTQDRPSSAALPDTDARHVDFRPESASPAAYPVIGSQPEGGPGAGEGILSLFIAPDSASPS